MTIPKFDETFNPILKILKNKDEEIHHKKVSDEVKRVFYPELTEEELKMKTSTGANLVNDRINWGITYLKQGKFLDRPNRGYVKITEKGLKYLKIGEKMNLSILKKDKDYLNHIPTRSKKGELTDKKTEEMSPQDMIDNGYNEILETLKLDLLNRLRGSDPYDFEEMILKLFKKMGYGDTEVTKKSNDGGIDGIINQDTLGIDKIYTQAKRYADGNSVGAKDMTNFMGAMTRDGIDKGIFVTTSIFSPKALETVKNHKMILIDGLKLVDLMVKYNLGVQEKNKFLIKEIDEEFFIQ